MFFIKKPGTTGYGKSSVRTETVSWSIWVSELEFEIDFEFENMSVY